ncbi:DUF4102 domain-containing protein [Ottowia sp.]|uniref:tyrosine-type recombinase/integrase n=1 Tax=Ottowia sp. TaxID=1898956 RepID=UPI00261D8D96|nr:DUF4102 domain-containing protein [Ottowia sp.]
MSELTQNVSDRTLRAWLNAGPVDKGIGGGLIFFARESSARQGQATWILRYRIATRRHEKVLGRYPDISLKDARELARRDRALIQQGVDVNAKKRQEKLKALQMEDVKGLGQIWYERHILGKIKNPQVVERVLRRHIYPVIGKLAIDEVRPHHIDAVLAKIVEAGAPTVANDAMRYLFRMFHYGAKRKWTDANPVAGFDLSDAGGTETPRDRFLSYEELMSLARDMRETPNFGRINELAVWLLLALCVRKMELLSARVTDFDLERGVWRLLGSPNHRVQIFNVRSLIRCPTHPLPILSTSPTLTGRKPPMNSRAEAWEAITKLSRSDFSIRIFSLGLSADRQDLLFRFIKGDLSVGYSSQIDIQQYALKCLMPSVFETLPPMTHPYASGELYEYDPPKNGQNIIKHGIGFGEVISYSRQFGTLIVPCPDGQDGERSVIFSDLNLQRGGHELELPPPGVRELNYTITVAQLRNGRFRFISSRLMSSKEGKYRKTMAQTFGEIIQDARGREDFVDHCVRIVQRDLIQSNPQ